MLYSPRYCPRYILDANSNYLDNLYTQAAAHGFLHTQFLRITQRHAALPDIVVAFSPTDHIHLHHSKNPQTHFRGNNLYRESV